MALMALSQSWCAWPLVLTRPILASILRLHQLSGMANKAMERRTMNYNTTGRKGVDIGGPKFSYGVQSVKR
jgi:hypothetical protein